MTTIKKTNAHDFLEKSFLDSQYDISSEIHCKFSEARPRAKNLHAPSFVCVRMKGKLTGVGAESPAEERRGRPSRSRCGSFVGDGGGARRGRSFRCGGSGSSKRTMLHTLPIFSFRKLFAYMVCQSQLYRIETPSL